MILSLIWQRYFFREVLKIFGLFLFSFYFLYVLMDYSLHMKSVLAGKSIPFFDLCLYYLFQFIKRSQLLLPLALLVASIKVLTTLNGNRELVALQTAGVPIKKLLHPFLLLGGLCCVFNWASNELLVPHSLNYIDRFYDANFKHAYSEHKKEPIHVLHLKDKSKLIYQFYDASKEVFFDAIWIRSSNDLWRIKYLKADPSHPVGEFVDHVQRNAEGVFEKTESFPSVVLKGLTWERNMPRKGFIPMENRAYSDLLSLGKQQSSSYERAEIRTQFYYKCVMPLMSLLIVVAIAPICMRYSRTNRPFFIYAIAIFGFVAFYALMDAAIILGENRVMSPALVVLSPFIISSAFFGWKYAKG